MYIRKNLSGTVEIREVELSQKKVFTRKKKNLSGNDGILFFSIEVSQKSGTFVEIC